MRKFQFLTIRNERQLKAFTGLADKEFALLVAEFTNCLKLKQQMRYQKNCLNRKRKPGGGRQGTLSTPELKLFFILFYLKNYPTFDVLGCWFDLSPAKAEETLVKLMPLLKQAEKRLQVLPHRHVKPASNNKQDNENIDKIIIDATERPYRRPRHDRQQKHYVSGKRRSHTLQNTVIGDVNNGIPVVGPTAAGSRHDYALLKDELNPNQPGLAAVEVDVDLAYQGIKDRYPTFHKIHIPSKKPRKSKDNPNPTLTPPPKKDNRAISRIRVIVENLIGDMKSFQILSIEFRNRIKNFGDQVILMVAGLCNLKNHYVVQ